MIIDLSLPIKNNTNEPEPPIIKYLNHVDGARHLIKGAIRLLIKKEPLKGVIFIILNFIHKILSITKLDIIFRVNVPSLSEKDFPDNMGLANEDLQLDTHAGTHLDAPYHFGPKIKGKKSKTIDKIPLEWCYSDGVVLDLRHKKSGEVITEADIITALKKIRYKIKPYDIVLIMTGSDKHFNKPDYFSVHPGMSAEATEYLIKQGVKIMGIDAWGFDRPAKYMIKDYLKTKDKTCIFPAHFVGRKFEYLHLEKLANLNKIPKPFGFKVICFPVKIEKAGAGWSRVVAIV